MVVALTPWDLQASGGYGTRFVGEDFGLSFESGVRKRFVSGEQARRYMAAWDRRYYGHLSRALPAASALLNKARKRGLGVGKLRLDLDALQLADPAEVERIDRRALPVNISFRLGAKGPLSQRIELTLVRPAKATAMKRLQRSLDAVLAYGRGKDEGDDLAEAPLAVRRPTPACAFDGVFAAYVGSKDKSLLSAQPALKRRFQDQLGRIMPGLQARFSAPKAASQLGVDKLLPVKPVARALAGDDLCAIFNPWGPLVDDGPPALLRMDMQVGRVQVIVMLAANKYDWGKVNDTLQTWLEEVAGTRHNRVIERQGRYLVLSRRGDRERSDVLWQMADSREPRFVALLGPMIRDRKASSSVRTKAAEILARIDQPIRRRVFLAVLSNGREKNNQVRQVAARALASYDDRKIVKLLTGIANDESADWNLRTACRESLATIAARNKSKKRGKGRSSP